MKLGKLDVSVLILLAAPFYLNDFSNIYTIDWRWWLFIDYVAVKLLPLLVIAWLIRSGRMGKHAFGFSPQPPADFVGAFLIATTLGILIDRNAYAAIASWPGYPPLGRMPEITSTTWNWIDLTFGLLLVGLLEELVFRAYACSMLLRFTSNRALVVAISSIAFGLIHWSLGLHSVLVTALIGAVFMVIYLHTRSIAAIVLAHFAVNFVDFSGAVPKSVLRFVQS